MDDRDVEDDRALMRAVANHDRGAERRLVRRVMALVHARARALTNTAADADDATQLSLIEVLRSARTYRGEGSIEAWSERIATRTTLRSQRKRARRLARIDDKADPDRVDTSQRSRKLAEELPADVTRFVAELSEDRYAAVMMRAQGFTVDEIAGALEISPNTVKDRIRTARKQLRRQIRQHEVLVSLRRQTT